MAHIYRRGKTWWIKFYAKGEPVYRSLGPITKQEAEAIKAEVEHQQKTRGSRHLVAGMAPFKDVLEAFLKDKRDHTEKATWKTYEKHARSIEDHFPVGYRIGDIKPEDIREFMRQRRKSVGVVTVNHERTTLSVIWNWAIHEELADRNPVLATKPFPKREEPPRMVHGDLVREYIAELQKADDRDNDNDRWVRALTADLLEVFHWTGWRMGETCALLQADINTERWECAIRSAWNKGNRTAFPIPVEARPVFERRLKAAGEFVFPALKGGNAYRAVYAFRNKFIARFPKFRAVKFHGLRHSFVTDLKRAKIDPHTRQGLSRHSSAAMLGHYTHDDLDDLRAAQARLSESRRQSKEPPRQGP